MSPLPNAAASTPSLRAPLEAPGGRYRILAELGRGGMATAYIAAMQGPGGFSKVVVVKRLRPILSREPEFLKMFLDEAKLAARIEHPNVVHTYDVARDGNDDYFIAMEYVEGQTFDAICRHPAPPLDNPGALAPFPLSLHLYVLRQVLLGLHAAHELKDYNGAPLQLVHRDVSPHNVAISYDGHVKLLDFGIAKAANVQGGTSTGVIKGKTTYMPAEQFGAAKDIDRRADIFAVGVMLWQALAGRRLWFGKTDAEIFAKVASGDLPSPSEFGSVLPELEAIAMKALSVNVADRFATASEMEEAIDEVTRANQHLLAGPREVGRWVSAAFREERDRVRKAVEDALAGPEGSGSIPVLPRPQSAPPPGKSAADSSAAKASSQGVSTSPRTSLGRSASIPLALLALVAFGGTAFYALRGRNSAADAGRETTRVVVDVFPEEAIVTLDDVVLRGKPRTANIPRDERIHRVRAEAPGFKPFTEEVRASSERTAVHVELAPALLPQERVPSAPTSSAQAPVVEGTQRGTVRPATPPQASAPPTASHVAEFTPTPSASSVTPVPSATHGPKSDDPNKRRGRVDPDNPYVN